MEEQLLMKLLNPFIFTKSYGKQGLTKKQAAWLCLNLCIFFNSFEK